MSDTLTKQRTCLNCGEDISHKKSNARYCSKACINAAYYQDNKEVITAKRAVYREENKETLIEYRAVYNQANKETIRAQQAVYRKENRDELAVRNSHRWYIVEEPYRDRICSIFERMNDSQRTRFANLLLRKAKTRILYDGKIDAWLADYNTLE